VWTFTYKSADEFPDWFQTTDAQFDTGTLVNTETYGSEQVRLSSAGYTERFDAWSASSADIWQEKDLSAYGVPANAVCEIVIQNSNGYYERYGGVRATGSSIERRAYINKAQDGGRNIMVMHVQADSASRIQHYADTTGDISFILVGYWTGATYVEKWQLFTAGASGSWLDINLSGYGVGANEVVEIVMTNDDTGNEQSAGVRQNGSSLQRRVAIQEAEDGGVCTATMMVNTDASSIIEAYAGSSSSIDFYLAGYWSSPPGTYIEKFDAVTNPSSDNTWQDRNLSDAPWNMPGNAVAEIVFGNLYASSENEMGVRQNGSALSRYLDIVDAEAGGLAAARMHVNADTSSIIEVYHEDVSDSHVFYLSGYWELVSSGTITSPAIDFDSFVGATDWNQLLFTDDETGGDIKYAVEYWDGDSWEPTAITNQDNSPVDISSLDTVTHNLIRIKATLTAGSTPYLHDWTITTTSCDEAECNLNDGWYDVGLPYACCDGNSACTCQDQQYRDYYCSGGSCTYSVTDTRTQKTGCTDCDGQDYYTPWVSYCNGTSIWRTRDLHDYYCFNGTCSENITPESEWYQDCPTDYYTEWASYCNGTSIWRTRDFHDYYCFNGTCQEDVIPESEFVQNCTDDYYTEWASYCNGTSIWRTRDLHDYYCFNGTCQEDVIPESEFVAECPADYYTEWASYCNGTSIWRTRHFHDYYCFNGTCQEDVIPESEWVGDCPTDYYTEWASYCNGTSIWRTRDFHDYYCFNGTCQEDVIPESEWVADCPTDYYTDWVSYCNGTSIWRTRDLHDYYCFNGTCQEDVIPESEWVGDCPTDYYTEWASYCNGTSIWQTRDFHDYYCFNGTCQEDVIPESEFVADCPTDYYTEWASYCNGTSVWRTRDLHDYYCFNGTCQEDVIPESEWVGDCPADYYTEWASYCNGTSIWRTRDLHDYYCFNGTCQEDVIPESEFVADCPADYYTEWASYCNGTSIWRTRDFHDYYCFNGTCQEDVIPESEWVADCPTDYYTEWASYCNGTSIWRTRDFHDYYCFNGTCQEDVIPESEWVADCPTDYYTEWASYCSGTSIWRTRDLHDYYCFNGTCQEDVIPESEWVADCDDGDPCTIDSCVDGACVHTPIDLDEDGYTVCGGDCDDNDNTIYPGAPELCDGKDNDCDTLVDEGVGSLWYQDSDSDTYGNPAVSQQACTQPSGYVSDSTDCNDSDANEHPNQVWYKDADNDGYSDGTTDTISCTRPGGYKVASELTAITGDCDDSNGAVNPAATEVCNGIDDDCDTLIDEGVTTTYYQDSDSDTYGNPAVSQQACSQPVGYVLDNTDCNDSDAAVNPGATEVPYNGKDDDCNAVTLDDDLDQDSYPIATDCDDTNAAVNPGATEVCNGIDDNCDGNIDEGCTYTITGYIRVGGIPLAGVLVTAHSPWTGTAITDANGKYELTGVPSGETIITLTPTLAGYTFDPPTFTITGPLTGPVEDMDFAAMAVICDYDGIAPATYAKIPFAIVQSGFHLVGQILDAVGGSLGLPAWLTPDLFDTIGSWVGGPLSWSVDMMGWGLSVVGSLLDALADPLGLPEWLAPTVNTIACQLFTPFSCSVTGVAFSPCG
jgi:hypothetical protein